MDEHNRKLKMEKLSPIPVFNPTALPDTRLTSAGQATPKSSYQHRKDAYAIESTSSPEVDQQGLLQTEKVGPKRRSRSLLSSKCKASVSKKPIRATPLLGLISRKLVCKGKNDGEMGHCDRLPRIDEGSEVTAATLLKQPNIETVSSPLKSSLDHSFRGSSIIGLNMGFPLQQKPSPSSYKPLDGIVVKKIPCASQTLNDSASNPKDIGNEEEDEMDTDASGSDADVSRIESFDSPMKLTEAQLKPISFEDFQQFRQRLALSSNKGNKEVLPSEEKTCFELCGTVLKKRKRALDFTSQTFLVEPTGDPLNADPEGDSRKEPGSSESPAHSSKIGFRVDEWSPESDNQSVIEGTPKSNSRFPVARNEIESTGGFATCSSLLIEGDSPSQSWKKEISALLHEPLSIGIHDELSNDALESKANNLELIVLSHDSSESEVETCAIDEETKNVIVMDSEAPFVTNLTKKSILSDESPTKMMKAFSEVVHIEACGSPDSDAPSEQDDGNDEIEEEKINASSTQEDFVEESEQIRPSKRRKKGSLLEKAAAVIARIEASSSLFDYEMKAGLRQNKGKFVSSPLVVCKRWDGDDSSLILICKPLNYKDECVEPSNLVALMVHKGSDVPVGSVVSVHFPLTIVYNSVLQMPYVLVGNQFVVNLAESLTVNSNHLDISDVVQKELVNSTSFSLLKPVTDLKMFPSNRIKLLSEAALCQNLIEEVVLILKVRHVVRVCHVSSPLKVVVLCCDDELHYCWIEFTSERNMKRATALETLHILTDGSQIQLQGFKIVSWTSIDKKTRNLANYCSNETLKHDTIFIVQPSETSWIISSSGRPRDVRKVRTSLQDILTQKVRGKRYLIDVESVECDEHGLTVKDSSNQVQYIPGENSYQTQFLPSSASFSLDAVYYYDGKIFSDEFTKIILKT